MLKHRRRAQKTQKTRGRGKGWRKQDGGRRKEEGVAARKQTTQRCGEKCENCAITGSVAKKLKLRNLVPDLAEPWTSQRSVKATCVTTDIKKILS